jgi:hypothetical protein
VPVLFKYTSYVRAWTIFDKDGNLLIERFVSKPIAMLLRLRYRLVVAEFVVNSATLLEENNMDAFL